MVVKAGAAVAKVGAAMVVMDLVPKADMAKTVGIMLRVLGGDLLLWPIP